MKEVTCVFEKYRDFKSSPEEISEILTIAAEAKGLTTEQVAALLGDLNYEQETKLFSTAAAVKKNIYGNRLVMFAPLYITNECTNGCLYCGFSRDNRVLKRTTLSVQETLEEVKFLEGTGHKRILLVAGEHPQYSNIKEIRKRIESIYINTGIRRINVNSAPMDIEEFKELKEAGIGTYQLFQETYNQRVYQSVHPYGKKADFNYRLSAPSRAIMAGIDDIGIGALFGLADYRVELLALLQHARYMETHHGVGPHTISVPRLKTAPGAKINRPLYEISDNEFKKIVAILRLAVPYTGIILSTRESPALRDELLSLGISQLSAGSSTSPGGYAKKQKQAAQFEVDDHRSLGEMLKSICEAGMLPSFCTACYRRKRTGKDFMDLAKKGDIKDFCQVNAILSFKEHLLDYGSDELNIIAKSLLHNEVNKIRDYRLKKITEQKLLLTEEGFRDQHI